MYSLNDVSCGRQISVNVDCLRLERWMLLLDDWLLEN